MGNTLLQSAGKNANRWYIENRFEPGHAKRLRSACVTLGFQPGCSKVSPVVSSTAPTLLLLCGVPLLLVPLCFVVSVNPIPFSHFIFPYSYSYIPHPCCLLPCLYLLFPIPFKSYPLYSISVHFLFPTAYSLVYVLYLKFTLHLVSSIPYPYISCSSLLLFSRPWIRVVLLVSVLCLGQLQRESAVDAGLDLVAREQQGHALAGLGLVLSQLPHQSQRQVERLFLLHVSAHRQAGTVLCHCCACHVHSVRRGRWGGGGEEDEWSENKGNIQERGREKV